VSLSEAAGCFGRLALIGLALIALIAGFLAWHFFRPDAYLNPLDRFFMTQFDNRTVQDPKSLIPDVFSRGMPKQMFVQVIEGMGYRENRNIVDELNESWYSKPGTFAVVCSNTFNVNARFDGTGLSEALAYRWATCL